MEIWYYDDEEQIAYTDLGPIPYNKLIIDTDEPKDNAKRDSKDE